MKVHSEGKEKREEKNERIKLVEKKKTNKQSIRLAFRSKLADTVWRCERNQKEANIVDEKTEHVFVKRALTYVSVFW